MDKDTAEKYRYCNYCKYFSPYFSVNGAGECTRVSIYDAGTYFDRIACWANYEMTIHNHFGIDYPEYIEEHCDAEHIRNALHNSIAWYKRLSKVNTVNFH